ncbi:MAG: zinc ribbon domain-containing protein [Acidobacteriota bacterium]|nr:zinc ribbon domain-containing protein [Acidobacteriota bacterium]
MAGKQQYQCSNCGAEVEQTDKFCKNCGVHFTNNASGSNTIQGDNNTGNFQNTGGIHGSNLSFNYGSENRIPTEFRRVKDTNLGITPRQVMALGMLPTLTGLLGFIGSIASIVALPRTLFPIFALFLLIGVALVLVGAFVRQRGFTGIPIPIILADHAFELDDEGYIHWTKIEGICPYCSGRPSRMKLRDYKDGEVWRKRVVCQRNPDHAVRFDHTALPGLK